MPPRVLVCTFATAEFAGSAEVLRYTALRHGGADGVLVYREADVQAFFDRHPDLLPNSRGYGWWAWKPYCILETLKRARPGDVVVYCDAGMAFEAPLQPYVDFLAAPNSALLFRLGEWPSKNYANRRWTKRDVFAFMDRTSDAHRDAVQVNAGIQMYRHCPEAIAFVHEWLVWCTDRRLIDDAHVLANPDDFVAHRHDQAILSVLAVDSSKVAVARDPSQYGQRDPKLIGFEPDVPLVDHHRKRHAPVSVAVITPTTGGPHLEACIRSVQAQELPNVTHWIVVDGPSHEAAVRAVIKKFEHRFPIVVLVLPRNVGAGGWNGHRTYGALPWLIDADYVAYLDDDNEFDPDHLRLLVRSVVLARAPWGFSLRRIAGEDGSQDDLPDNCESLGGLGVTPEGDRLVDTSCYLLERDLAIRASPVWNARFRDPTRPEPDRHLCRALLDLPYACVRQHTVRYRPGNTQRSVTRQYFEQGNARAGYNFAKYPDVYVFHFSADATKRMLAARRDPASHALDEWNMTLWKGLDGGAIERQEAGETRPGRYNLLDGYACMPHIPPGACVLAALCMPHEFPWDFFKERTDLWRVGYTLESPNIRHADQWDPLRLKACFDVVLTYWQPLLDDPRVPTRFCPHNTHHLDLDDPADAAQLRANAGVARSCGMVLERRDLSGQYAVPNVPGVTLTCLDGLREVLVKDLSDVTVFGVGWDAAAARNPGIKLGHALHRSKDPRSSVDILQQFTFAVVVENCDAEGYASEKLFDALIAGCIPLYYGSLPPRLGVPEGVDQGVYLDVKALCAGTPQAQWSARVQAFIDGLTDAQLEAWKARVVALRPGILANVGVRAFADTVRAALESKPA